MDINPWFTRMREWLVTDFLTWTQTYQIILILVTISLAWFVRNWLRVGYQNYLRARGRVFAPGPVYKMFNEILFPLIALFLLFTGQLIASYLGYPVVILHIISSLLLAWVVIRLMSLSVRNQLLARSIAIVIWMIAALNILGLLRPILDILNGIAFNIGNVNLSILTIFKGILYLILSVWIASLLASFIESRLKSTSALTPSARVLTGKFIRIILITAAFLLAVSAVGIDLTIFAVFGGALGVGLGFGLQKVVSNYISGIILLMDRSIKPGDVISIGETYGWVKSLNARYVSLDTRNGIEHLIPNEELITTRVENWSYSNNKVRLHVPIGIHYKSDVRKAIALCMDAALEEERILDDPKPVCILKGFGDSSVDLELRMWIEDPQHGRANVISKVLLKVWDKFHEHGIEIPYPQQDVHFMTPLDIKNI